MCARELLGPVLVVSSLTWCVLRYAVNGRLACDGDSLVTVSLGGVGTVCGSAGAGPGGLFSNLLRPAMGLRFLCLLGLVLVVSSLTCDGISRGMKIAQWLLAGAGTGGLFSNLQVGLASKNLYF
ncbi:hypothetical protein BC832DRAFT_541755 [Gaertneriomyces semiglobifer]|nr:hypothetical protein BC832DRAFT_541755 [Gaertneriomyces semiglobifer]